MPHATLTVTGMTVQAASPRQLEHFRDYVRQIVLATSPLAPFQPRPARREVRGNVLLIAGEQRGPDHNAVLALGTEPAERVFGLAAQVFGLPATHVLDTAAFGVELMVETATEVEAALKSHSWQLEEEEPALVLAPLPTNPPAPPTELTIHHVATDEDLAAWREVSRTGPRWISSLAAATARGVALFLGKVDGQVVAVSRVACMGEPPLRVADITGVVTIEAFRRRGYGTAMTWETVREAARQGCDAAVLTATPLGYPVYLRMGFVPVCTMRTYAPPAPTA